MKRKRFKKIHDGEWHMPIMKGYLMKCCDCGLVHRMNFRIIDGKTQKPLRKKRVLIQAFRSKFL